MQETSDNSEMVTSPKAPLRGSGAMFDNMAKRYDLLNRLMSFGVDKRWRKRTVLSLGLAPGNNVLDLATGTGDLAIDIAKRSPGVTVVGVDPSIKMLEIGIAKIEKAKLGDRITMEQGIGEDLPFEDNTFDAVTIAFGIRNCTDRPQALREMRRVVRPGGRVGVLELSEPKGGFMAPFARFHIHQVIPRIGSWLSGARKYRYLQESIADFPSAEDFSKIIEDCGLEMLDLISFSFGSCHLYLASVPENK